MAALFAAKWRCLLFFWVAWSQDESLPPVGMKFLTSIPGNHLPPPVWTDPFEVHSMENTGGPTGVVAVNPTSPSETAGNPPTGYNDQIFAFNFQVPTGVACTLVRDGHAVGVFFFFFFERWVVACVADCCPAFPSCTTQTSPIQ